MSCISDALLNFVWHHWNPLGCFGTCLPVHYCQYNKGDIFSRHKRCSHLIYCIHTMQLQRQPPLKLCWAPAAATSKFAEPHRNSAIQGFQSFTFEVIQTQFPSQWTNSETPLRFARIISVLGKVSMLQCSFSVECNLCGNIGGLHNEKFFQGCAVEYNQEVSPTYFLILTHTQAAPRKTWHKPPPSSHREHAGQNSFLSKLCGPRTWNKVAKHKLMCNYFSCLNHFLSCVITCRVNSTTPFYFNCGNLISQPQESLP